MAGELYKDSARANPLRRLETIESKLPLFLTPPECISFPRALFAREAQQGVGECEREGVWHK